MNVLCIEKIDRSYNSESFSVFVINLHRLRQTQDYPFSSSMNNNYDNVSRYCQPRQQLLKHTYFRAHSRAHICEGPSEIAGKCLHLTTQYSTGNIRAVCC